MRLPFTQEQFLSVFASYNTTLIIPITLLWVLTAVLLALTLRRERPRLLSGMLAVHWLRAGLVYHLGYFASINPAARLFGALFILQGILFLWFGVIRQQLKFLWGRAPRQVLGPVLSGYGLAYPLLVAAAGLRWPAMPSFGVPCPTSILTVGLLLAAEPRRLRGLYVIPLVWTGIGGSAAVLLGVLPDYMLLLAGVLLLLNPVAPRAWGAVP